MTKSRKDRGAETKSRNNKRSIKINRGTRGREFFYKEVKITQQANQFCPFVFRPIALSTFCLWPFDLKPRRRPEVNLYHWRIYFAGPVRHFYIGSNCSLKIPEFLFWNENYWKIYTRILFIAGIRNAGIRNAFWRTNERWSKALQ